MKVGKIRNLIMRSSGEGKDKAEEVAKRYLDEFWQEVFKAIRRMMGKELGIGV
jgi:hypothetical protein